MRIPASDRELGMRLKLSLFGRRGRQVVVSGLLMLSVSAIAGCQFSNGLDELKVSSTSKGGYVESHVIAARGIESLNNNKPERASELFNAALKLNIQNSYLQLLNAIAYHEIARDRDASVYSLAEEGYRLAIQFDPNNWLARYYLGRLQLDQRKFRVAQQSFAEAINYSDADPDLLYDFVVASYFAQDPEAAAGALTQLQKIEPSSIRTIRASSLVSAAVGDQKSADLWLQRYEGLAKEADVTGLTRRLMDWRRVHRLVQKASLSNGTAENERRPYLRGFGGGQAVKNNRNTESEKTLMLAQADSENEAENEESDESEEESIVENLEDPEAAEKPMVIVDVVIISTVEDIKTAKGVNLLNGLKFQFGGPDLSGFQWKRSYEWTDDGGTRSDSKTIVRALTIPSITYSLNIANSGSNRNEILARPSLVAQLGKTSKFFSGVNIKASAVSKTSAESATSVDQDIGVALAITPLAIEPEKIGLQISVERTFLQSPSANVQFDYQINTSKTRVSANVALRRGETLILSGLSEKEVESIRDGVPGLQEIPGIQYFFSRATTRDFNRSVMVLVTPRNPEYTYREATRRLNTRDGSGSGPSKSGETGDSNDNPLSQLKARYTDWFKPYPNWASVFNHLQKNRLYREFRTGDVQLERWESHQKRENRLKNILDFIIY